MLPKGQSLLFSRPRHVSPVGCWNFEISIDVWARAPTPPAAAYFTARKLGHFILSPLKTKDGGTQQMSAAPFIADARYSPAILHFSPAGYSAATAGRRLSGHRAWRRQPTQCTSSGRRLGRCASIAHFATFRFLEDIRIACRYGPLTLRDTPLPASKASHVPRPSRLMPCYHNAYAFFATPPLHFVRHGSESLAD